MVSRRAPLTILLLAGAVIGCGRAEADHPAKPDARPRIRVQVEPAQTRPIREILRLHAELRPLRQTRIATGTGGKVDAVRVEEGQAVEKGTLLAEIASSLAVAQLHQAEADERAARANLKRTERLAAKGLASPAAVDEARARHARAEAALALARVRQRDAFVRAPHAGVVARRFIDPSEFAAPGAPLFDLVDLSTLEAVAQLPERDLPSMGVGRRAVLRVDAMPDRPIESEVTRIGVAADPNSRTFEVVVRVPNTDRSLRPGMLARLELVRHELDAVVAIPRDAVVDDVEGRGVFVVRDGVAVRKHVTLGPIDGDYVAVLDGIAAGDPIVVLGQRQLVAGEAVEVLEEHAEAVDTKAPREVAVP